MSIASFTRGAFPMAAAALVAMGVASCEKGAAGKTIVLGFVAKNQTNPVFQVAKVGSQEAAEELGKKVAGSEKRIDPRLLPYARGAGIRVRGEARFYPDREGDLAVLDDTVGGWSVLVLRGGGSEPALVAARHGPDP